MGGGVVCDGRESTMVGDVVMVGRDDGTKDVIVGV